MLDRVEKTKYYMSTMNWWSLWKSSDVTTMSMYKNTFYYVIWLIPAYGYLVSLRVKYLVGLAENIHYWFEFLTNTIH